MAKLTTEEFKDCQVKTEQIIAHFSILTKQERGAMTEAAKKTGISQQNISKARNGAGVGRDTYNQALHAWRRIFGVSRQFEVTASYAKELLNYDREKLNRAIERAAQTSWGKSEDPEKILAAILKEYSGNTPTAGPGAKGGKAA